MPRRIVFVTLAGAILGIWGCGERSTAPKTVAPVTPPAVASIGVVPSNVALEVGQQRAVEATLYDGNGASLSGRVVQWQSSSSAVATVSASTGGIATVAAVSPGSTTIVASSEGKSAAISVTVTTVPALDFSIIDAQWTQGVQQADGAIPMILDGNAAVLNVLLSTTTANRAPGQLVLTLSDGSGTSVRADTLLPFAFSGVATYDAPSAQFLLPKSSLRAGLRWQVHRDPRKILADADLTNDAFPRSAPALLTTVVLPTMRVRFVPIVLSAHGDATGNVSLGTLESYLPTLRRAFPLGPLTASVGTPVVSAANFGVAPNGGSETFWLQVLQDIDLARVADTSSRDTYWMAVVRPPTGFTFTSFGGMAYIPFSPASVGRGSRSATVVQTGWFSNTTQSADLVAHELAHTLGRRHAPCGGATGVDPAFPITNGFIGTVGHDVYGWSIGQATSAGTRAATTGDLMGYCFPQWASPYTYAGLLAARLASVTSAISAPTTPARRQHVVVVRGRIDGARVSLLPIVSIDGFPSDGTEGAYRVELIDAAGRVIATQRTDAVAVDHANVMTFVAAVPLDETTARSMVAARVVGPAGAATRRR